MSWKSSGSAQQAESIHARRQLEVLGRANRNRGDRYIISIRWPPDEAITGHRDCGAIPKPSHYRQYQLGTLEEESWTAFRYRLNKILQDKMV